MEARATEAAAGGNSQGCVAVSQELLCEKMISCIQSCAAWKYRSVPSHVSMRTKSESGFLFLLQGKHTHASLSGLQHVNKW